MEPNPMRCDVPARTTDVRHTNFFVYQRNPITRLVTSYRASDGFDVGTDSSFEDAAHRTEVFQAVIDGELF